MGVIELFEIGFFMAFWNWSTPILTVLLYFCVVVGFVLQFILEKKYRKSAVRWAILGFCICCIFISECVWQFSRDQICSDIINVDILYGSIMCLLLGVIIAMLISNFRNKQV